LTGNGETFPKKAFCSSCGAEAQRTSVGLRCPWATSAHQRTVWVNGELLLDCGSPYERERIMALPSQTRTR
jgi:hypothetical protein